MPQTERVQGVLLGIHANPPGYGADGRSWLAVAGGVESLKRRVGAEQGGGTGLATVVGVMSVAVGRRGMGGGSGLGSACVGWFNCRDTASSAKA